MKKTGKESILKNSNWGNASSHDKKSHKSSSRNEQRLASADSRGAGDEHFNTSRRFEEACAQMRQNAQKFIGDSLNYESSASEDELDDLSIIQKTLQEYNEDGVLDLKKTREFLQDSLTSGALVCLICIESIKRNDAIWSCDSCHCMLHLECIQKWAKDSLFHQSEALEDRKKNDDLKWRCPKCRSEYRPSEKPSRYLCFCGKLENPKYDPWTVPHSCGHSCEKKLKPVCGHICNLLCHPGPCPPCPKTVEVSCYCLNSKATTRRCSNKYWSCGQPCNKMLSCKQHYCKEACHGDDCPPCLRQSEQRCQCGSEKKLRPCNDATWQCGNICLMPLECGSHQCSVVCHGGKCPPCPRSGARPCPCTKKIAWLPCTEEVGPCGDTCDKLLECELHRCSQRCHFGLCGSCLQMRVMKCRCNQREKPVPCCKEYICDIKCKLRRDCGRHNCNRKCCTGNCPPCEAPCLRTLNCGRHKCASRCHPGPCYPCRETVSISCNCGTAEIFIPCGRKKSAVPPKCTANCKIPPDCHHPERHKHRCHFDSCPPCRLTCKKNLSCDHVCPARCHSAILTKIETNKKKEGPWDLINSYKMELICKPCPPCVVPVPVTCLGMHQTYDVACSEAKVFSCGKPCGRQLSCGNHTCTVECHKVVGAENSLLQGKNCQQCEEPCRKERKEECNHPCNRACHPGDCNACTQLIKKRCHCQINAVYVACDDWSEADMNKRAEMLSCKNRCPKEMSCGHRCTLTCHGDSCSDRSTCKKKIVLRCPCKRQKRDVQCFTQIENPTSLECDNACFEQKGTLDALKQAEVEKKKAEEKERSEQELQEFLKKTEGKKKKRKKVKEVQEEGSWFKRHIVFISASASCIVALLVLTYINFIR